MKASLMVVHSNYVPYTHHDALPSTDRTNSNSSPCYMHRYPLVECHRHRPNSFQSNPGSVSSPWQNAVGLLVPKCQDPAIFGSGLSGDNTVAGSVPNCQCCRTHARQHLRAGVCGSRSSRWLPLSAKRVWHCKQGPY